MQNQPQQQQQRNSARPQKKSHRGKKRPQQQVNELVAFTGVLQLDGYTLQTSTLFAPATYHYTNDIDDFIEYETGDYGSIRTAEAGTDLPITARSTVIIEHDVLNEQTGKVKGQRTTIPNVSYVEKLSGQILSTNAFLKGGWSAIGWASYTILLDINDKPILMAQEEVNGSANLHYVHSRVVKNTDIAMKTIRFISYHTWHIAQILI
jgi:hypothetical protein